MDLRAMAEILRDPRTRTRDIVSVVFAGRRRGWEPKAWVAVLSDDDGEEIVIRRGIIVVVAP